MADPPEQVHEAPQEPQEPEVTAETSSPAEPKDVGIQGEDEATRLKALAADVRDQDDLERDVGRQVLASSRVWVSFALIVGTRQTSCSQSKPTKETRSVLTRHYPTKISLIVRSASCANA